MALQRTLLFALLCAGCDASPPDAGVAPGSARESGATSAFADPASCAGCHPAEHAAWAGSHHDDAMQPAGPESVKGDFDGAEFSQHGVTTRFTRSEDGRYLVHTEGEDGVLSEFEVAYTFGVDPLQQYLIAFPRGRLQSLTIAWDTRRGQWFSLYPDEAIPPGDPLHWTGPLQRWNSMCADCHATAYARGFDLASDTYSPHSVALDVSCQACHGPAAAHVAFASEASGSRTAAAPRLLLAPGGPASAEIEACAPCHSRRHPVSAAAVIGEPLLDHYAPELLRPDLYHADGQIDAEVYEYGSFLQSRMYRQGVRCSDCHEPHSLQLRAEGDALCVRCHSPEPDARFPTLAARRYDSPDHHFHPQDSAGARCVSCHMPEKLYMEVDGRRDHSLRVPRPDLSVELGTPNACTGCHADRDAGWAADLLASRRPAEAPLLPFHFGEAIEAARPGRAGADAGLRTLARDRDQPAIARATAVWMLQPWAGAGDAEALRALADAAEDPDALVRLAAASALESAPAASSLPVLVRLASDPRRAVRVEAARVLSGLPQASLSDAELKAFGAALDEFIAAQRALGDTGEAHFNLAVLHARRGRPAAAEDSYRTALRLRPDFTPARVNLATLLASAGRAAEAEAELRSALAAHQELSAQLGDVPDARALEGEIHYSLALLLAESAARLDEAAAELARAAELLPERARIHYNRGLALQRLARPEEALSALLRAETLAPEDPDVQNALAILYTQSGRVEDALRHAERAIALTGGSAEAKALVEQIHTLESAP